MAFEIERKYLIKMPSASVLSEADGRIDIIQTYLRPLGGETISRVRESRRGGEVVYTFTQKRRISGIKCEETERIITGEEYREMLSAMDRTLRQVKKTRYIFIYDCQRFELDVYPFWTDKAVLELELEDEAQTVRFPPFLELIREVTEDERYKNRALAEALPKD